MAAECKGEAALDVPLEILMPMQDPDYEGVISSNFIDDHMGLEPMYTHRS